MTFIYSIKRRFFFDSALSRWAMFITFVVSFGCAGASQNLPPAAVGSESAKPVQPEEDQTPTPPKFEVTDRIELTTSMGSMVIGLYGKAAPRTVENFLHYVDSGFYNGKIFHRIIAGFMIQGGGFDENLNHAEPGEPIHLELAPGLKHEPGVIAMARQPNDLHSATSQFFICVASAPQLNGAYSAFGKVEKGEEVMYAIAGVPTHSVETDYGKMDDVPSAPVVIESIRRLQPDSKD